MRTAIGLGDPGQRILAHLGGEREDAVEQRIGGLGQIEQMRAPVFRIGAALDQPRRLQPVEQPGQGDRLEIEDLRQAAWLMPSWRAR